MQLGPVLCEEERNRKEAGEHGKVRRGEERAEKDMNFESYAFASLRLGWMKRKMFFIHSDVGCSTGFCAHKSVHPLAPCMHDL